MNGLKEKKTCYFPFWRKTFFVMKEKKETKLVIERKQAEVFVISFFPAKNVFFFVI